MSEPILYVEPDAVKATLGAGETEDAALDADLVTAIDAASRAVEHLTDRVFYQRDESNDQVRLYTVSRPTTIDVDDFTTLTTVELDLDGDGTYETELVEADFVLEPLNAEQDGKPWERIRLRRPELMPVGVLAGVKVTGRFGWLDTPVEVLKATEIIAVKLLKRPRDAPWSVLAADINGSAIRIGSFDAEVQMLLRELDRRPVVG